MPKRIFPVPFQMTMGSIKTLENPDTPPVQGFMTAMLFSASVLMDLIVLPGALADSARLDQLSQMQLPGG